MSMTKRYLESLPKERQDDILGLPQDDEWTESAENEPTKDHKALGAECDGPNCEICYYLAAEADTKIIYPPTGPDDDIYRGEGDLKC